MYTNLYTSNDTDRSYLKMTDNGEIAKMGLGQFHNNEIKIP